NPDRYTPADHGPSSCRRVRGNQSAGRRARSTTRWTPSSTRTRCSRRRACRRKNSSSPISCSHCAARHRVAAPPEHLNRRMRFVVLLCAAASIAGAQTSSGADAVFARAKQLVVSGNGAAGRVLIDSVLAANNSDSPVYADALYWRAALAATPQDAERDYRRLVVEYPLASKTGDALFQLAQLETARGDRISASEHLQEYLLDNPKAADRQRAHMQLVPMLFDLN